MDTSLLVFLITKAVAAGYVLLSSITALLLLLCCKAFHRLTYRLLIYVLLASVVLSSAIEFDTVAVNILAHGRTTPGGPQEGRGNHLQFLCVISGAMIHYATLLDILVMSWCVAWLVKMAGNDDWKKDVVRQSKKTKGRQKICECVGLIALTLIPVLAIIIPLVLSLYEEGQGPWCRIRVLQTNTTGEGSGMVEDLQRDFPGVLVGFFTLYVPEIALLVTNSTLLVYGLIKLTIRLCSKENILPERYINHLKDGIMLAILMLVFSGIYCIWLAGFIYFLITLDASQSLWIMETAIFGVRGAAIFCIVFNPKMCSHIKKARRRRGQLNAISAASGISNDSLTVEGSFRLQELPNGGPSQTSLHIRPLPSRNENGNVHIRALPSRNENNLHIRALPSRDGSDSDQVQALPSGDENDSDHAHTPPNQDENSIQIRALPNSDQA